VNTTTGELSVSETPDGEHIIFYSLTTNSGCEITYSDTIIIIANPDATFNYFPDTIFIGDVNAVPNIIGEAGIFTVVPEGLLFADVFGVIDLINSTPGSYIIYNTVSNSICTQTDSFTVSILPECIAPQQVTVDYFNSNTLIISWEINIDYTDYTVLLINGEDTLFYTSTDNTITINDLDAETTYIIIVLTNCSSQKTNAADSIVITTAALNLTTSIAPQINIYPNPTSGDITIESDLLAHGGQITIFNLNGQLIYDEIISENYNNYVLKANTLVAGYYYIQISNGYKMHYGSVVIE
ncbi:MAG: T9SS type A sorting domain-containing protein, partial [Chitinophagales bacterium]